MQVRLTCSTRSFPADNQALSLARIKWAGFPAVEVALEPGDEPPDLDALKTALEKNELELSGIDAGTLEFDSREEALEAAAHIGRCGLLAHQLDGARVLFRAASGTLEYLSYGLGQLLAAMPGYGFDLCPVNMPEGVLSAPEDFEELLARVESERLALALDPAAASAAGWDADEFARAAETPLGYVFFTDLLDGRPALPGAGDLDWEQLVAALRADGYDGYLSLLLPGDDPLRAESDAKEARGYAEALIHSAD